MTLTSKNDYIASSSILLSVEFKDSVSDVRASSSGWTYIRFENMILTLPTSSANDIVAWGFYVLIFSS